MEQGWVYVLVNSTIPGLAKVGRTSRAPAQRAAELSAVTGVATPFVLAFDQYFTDCHAAERTIHAALDQRGWRVAPNREFFRGPPSEIIRMVLEAGEPDGRPVRPPNPQTPDILLAAGDRALHGTGEALQDTGEAVRCFKLAAARGSLLALERLGGIYGRIYATRRDNASRRRAMAPLKDGARRGNAYCYCEMAALFAAEGSLGNFTKAWDLFFAGRAPASEAVASAATQDANPAGAGEAARFIAACCRYIGLCLDLGLPLAHATELRAASVAILAALMGELDRNRTDPVLRLRATGALRHAYAVLSPAPSGPRANRPARWWRHWRPAHHAAAA